MQTSTFLQKAHPRPSWRVLLGLLAIFIGLCSQTAWAAVSLSNGTVVVNQGNGNNTYAETDYDNATLIDQKPGSTTTPAFDINTGTLILNGGTITTTETGTSGVTGVALNYILYDPNYQPVSQGAITLSQTSSSNGVRTFSASNSAISIIPLVPNADNGYSLAITFVATYRNGSTGRPLMVSGNTDYASFDVNGVRTPAPTVSPVRIRIATDSSSNAIGKPYYFPTTGTSPQFPGYNFTSTTNAGGTSGAFDINNGQLRLINTTVTTTEAGANTVSSVVLYYRTRLSGSGGGAFQPITLTQSGSVSGGTRTFIIDPASANNTNSQPNLIATPAVTAPGNYIVDIYYQASGVNSGTGNTFTIVYPPTGYSSATFTVGGTPIATTIWTGAVNDNWFDPSNWSAGVPSSATNALIRDLGAGNSVPYPNINSDVAVYTASGALLYDNSGSGPAMTLNFTMGGSSQASRSIARLVKGQLKVYGNFDNSYDSFIQRESTIMEFAGTNQTITGGSFGRVDISGGGTKTLNGLMNVAESLNFLTTNVYTNAGNPLATNPYTTLNDDAGILATDITQPATNLVQLADRSTNNFNNGAQLNGENDASFMYGFVRTTRQGVSVGEARTYGNIGMDLTFTGSNSPGNVEVTRNTVEAYAPGPNKFGIRRIFGVRPSDQATNSGGLTADMVFHYRDAETKNLNGPNTITPGNGKIPESRLTIFVSNNSGNTFGLIGRVGAVDSVNNKVAANNVRNFATFTLGDELFPLPVTLVAFGAIRQENNTLLTWTTASEERNTGFNVQVSTDGTNFRTLSFVSSKSPNSSTTLNYKYTDTEASKTGTRYYRLEQVDEGGAKNYSPVRLVNFSGTTTGTSILVAYPNPFNEGVSLTLDGGTVADGAAVVKLVDMTGRTVRESKLPLVGASLTLSDMGTLHSGLYLAKVTLPDGSTQTVRISKQ